MNKKILLLRFCKITISDVGAAQILYEISNRKDSDKNIHELYNKMKETKCLCGVKRSGWPYPSAESVSHVRETVTRVPSKSTHVATNSVANYTQKTAYEAISFANGERTV